MRVVEKCANLQEVFEHRNAAYLLSILHTLAFEARFQRVKLSELLGDSGLFREAVKHLFRANPAFDTAEISAACDHAESLIKAGEEPIKIPSKPEPLAIHAKQAKIPESILETPLKPPSDEYAKLIEKVGFEAERGPDTRHSRALDRSLLAWQIHHYTNEKPDCGPNRESFEVLQETPGLFTSLGHFLRARFPGIQLVDVCAGTANGIISWAELFGAKACIYVDQNYEKNTHEKRGETDFYRLKGDALQVVSQLPEGIGSFHVAGMELLARWDYSKEGRSYLLALAKEMHQKTLEGGLLLVGQMHCSLEDSIVREAGFKPVEIPRVYVGLEAEDYMDWRNRYRVYEK